MATLKMFNTTGNEEVIFRDVYFFIFLNYFLWVELSKIDFQ